MGAERRNLEAPFFIAHTVLNYRSIVRMGLRVSAIQRAHFASCTRRATNTTSGS
jgi:hypothetical protein